MSQPSTRLTGGGERGSWSRRRGFRALLVASLASSLVLGGTFLLVGRLHSTPDDVLDHPAHPMSDAQAESQVVEAARQIVAAAGLRGVTAGYLLMSCKNRADPPYQGAIYLDFALPTGTRPDVYFRSIAAAMIRRGWQRGRPPNQHRYGIALYRDGLNTVVYQNSDNEKFGILRLYGECRNINDHRNDTTAWVDVTSELR